MSARSGASTAERATEQPSEAAPFYLAIGEECTLFETAFRERLPLLLKGPTGCGKTRFVAHMAAHAVARPVGRTTDPTTRKSLRSRSNGT